MTLYDAFNQRIDTLRQARELASAVGDALTDAIACDDDLDERGDLALVFDHLSAASEKAAALQAKIRKATDLLLRTMEP
jgi:hypothetical protein